MLLGDCLPRPVNFDGWSYQLNGWKPYKTCIYCIPNILFPYRYTITSLMKIIAQTSWATYRHPLYAEVEKGILKKHKGARREEWFPTYIGSSTDIGLLWVVMVIFQEQQTGITSSSFQEDVICLLPKCIYNQCCHGNMTYIHIRNFPLDGWFKNLLWDLTWDWMKWNHMTAASCVLGGQWHSRMLMSCNKFCVKEALSFWNRTRYI